MLHAETSAKHHRNQCNAKSNVTAWTIASVVFHEKGAVIATSGQSA
jgi:hypothetical protein